MRITPIDIEAKRFPMKFRGFHPEEVSSFLEQIREELEDLLRENAALKDRLQRTDDEANKFREMQDQLSRTLQDAHQVSEEYKIHARREIDDILEKAEERSRDMAREAHEKALHISEEIIELKMHRKGFADGMKTILDHFNEAIYSGVMPLKSASASEMIPSEVTAADEEAADNVEDLLSAEDQEGIVEGHAGEEARSEGEDY